MFEPLCKHCGQPIIGRNKGCLYHTDCRKIVKYEKNKLFAEINADKVKQHRKNYQEKMKANRPPRMCQLCGEVELVHPQKKFCAECSKVKKKTLYVAEKPNTTTNPKPKKPKPLKHCWSHEHKSLVQIDIEARSLNMSYGQYISLIDTLQMDRHLQSIGITNGLERIEKAWREYKAQQKLKQANNILRSDNRAGL